MKNNSEQNSILGYSLDGNVLNTLWNLPNHYFVHWILDSAYNFSDKLQIIINESKNKVNNNTIPYILFTRRDIEIAEKLIATETTLPDECKRFLNEIISIKNRNRGYSIPSSTFKIEKIVEQSKIILELLNLTQLDIKNLKPKFTTWLNLSTDLDAKINTVIQNKFYLSSPLSFNDRFDCQIHASDEFYKDILTHVSNSSVTSDDIFDLKLHLNLLISRIRIACFSTKDPLCTDSTNMWGLYGNKGKGIAVSYNFADLLLWFTNYFQNGDENKSIEYVKYSENHKPSEIIQELVNYAFINKGSTTINNMYRGLAEGELHRLMFTKGSTWEHEEELRVIHPFLEQFKSI